MVLCALNKVFCVMGYNPPLSIKSPANNKSSVQSKTNKWFAGIFQLFTVNCVEVCQDLINIYPNLHD